ncbi:MAG: hypothetical protein HQL69_05910 [Magnetococcales bacterium]|nr:hypothetical protein [Magnetococcales bacterium]
MNDAEKIAKLEALCAAYRRTLFKVPHSRGDHSDLCRINNGGETPATPDQCSCHVGLVNKMLKVEADNSNT